MKKGTVIALIVAAAMIIVGATLVNFARGRGENVLDYFNGNADLSFNGGAIHIGVDQKDYTVCLDGEESFSAEEVQRLDLDWISGSVTVEPYDGKTVVIREESAEKLSEGQRMRWKLSGGTLSVLFCANDEKNVPKKDLTVLLPRSYQADSVNADAVTASVTLRSLVVKGTIDTDTTSGAILVSECSCAALDAETTSGSVSVEATAVKREIDIDTTSGTISVSACSCAALDAETTSGSVSVEATAVKGAIDVDTTSGAIVMQKLPEGSEVNVDTVSGAVELHFAGAPREVDVSTNSGAVILAFPKGTTIDLDYDTGSGRLSGTVNSSRDGVPVDVDTLSGNLTIAEG